MLSPFFIGWEEKPKPAVRSFLRRITVVAVISAIAVAALGAALQGTIGSGRFEFGNIREFTGVFVRSPAPLLVSDEPVEGERVFYLVYPLKYGFPTELAKEHHLREVRIRGTLIQDDRDAMIEVSEMIPGEKTAASSPLEQTKELDKVTLTGEIVDSKCHIGVMNPGRFKPHRACATQCIKGGIPPILVARTSDGALAHYLLVGPEGEALNDQVLDLIALPVTVTGTLLTIGERLVLQADPGSIKRL